MSTPILICAGITALLLIFVISQIVSHLYDIHIDLCHIHEDLVAMDDWHFERLVRSLPKSPNEDIVRAWRDEMRKDPLIIQAAKSEAPPMDWRDCEYDPDLINKVLKEKLL